MSHVTTVDCEITCLDTLRDACEAAGVEMIEKDSYKWWGHHVGDYPLPEGFKESDLGKCEFAIRRKDQVGYEVGVVRRRNSDGTIAEGWTLIYDFYGGQGKMIEELVGERCTKVVNEYAVAATLRFAKKNKKKATVHRISDTEIRVELKARH